MSEEVNIIIGWQKYETEFAGKKVTMQLRPLLVPAMLLLTPFVVSTDDKDDLVRLAISAYELQEKALAIFPDHVRDITGLTINGEPPTWEQLATESVLNSLAADIVGELFRVSSLPQAEAKNLPSPSHSQPQPDGDAE